MVMWSAFRTTFFCLRTASASLSLNSSSTTVTRRTTFCSHFFTSMAGLHSFPNSTAVEKSIDKLCHHLDESERMRDRIREVATNIGSTSRIGYYDILLDLRYRPIPEILEEANSRIDVLKPLFCSLALIVGENPEQYYRYHGDWRTEAQLTVSLLGLTHWLESGSLLLHTKMEEKLGLNALEFGLDIEDYLVGLCTMSNDLATYADDQLSIFNDYDCHIKVLKFVTNLRASLHMLCVKNDFLHRKFHEKDLTSYKGDLEEDQLDAEHPMKTYKGDLEEDQLDAEHPMRSCQGL